jgi:hypothetical protein
MKPTRVFLSVTSVAPRRPAGADPFTYRETRPLRYRASWWTRGTSTELYRSKTVATQEEAVRLARKFLDGQNKDGERWIDTTDQPQRFGYAHDTNTPVAHATRKGGSMKRFYGTIEYLPGQREAIVALHDAKGDWFGAERITLPRAKHGRRALYDQGYSAASIKAANHGGELETFKEIKT